MPTPCLPQPTCFSSAISMFWALFFQPFTLPRKSPPAQPLNSSHLWIILGIWVSIHKLPSLKVLLHSLHLTFWLAAFMFISFIALSTFSICLHYLFPPLEYTFHECKGYVNFDLFYIPRGLNTAQQIVGTQILVEEEKHILTKFKAWRI